MPFIAINKNTQERIDITKIEQPRIALREADCVCQACGERLIVRSEFLRSGYLVRAYFYHYRGDCNSEYSSHPESPEHLRCKEIVANTLQTQFNEFSEAIIEYEVKVPEAKRIADIMVTFPMGWRVAHEVQLSPISPDKLEERTRAYNSVGIDVFWWLGKSADNAANRTWCLERYGYSLIVEISRSSRQSDSIIISQENHP